jgi:hypothetical protein
VSLGEVEGVGGGTDEGLAVEDFLGEGADEGLAAELAVEALLGLGEDVLDVEGTWGGFEYVFDDGDIGLTFMSGEAAAAPGRGAEGAEGAELGMGDGFERIEELIVGEGFGGVGGRG